MGLENAASHRNPIVWVDHAQDRLSGGGARPGLANGDAQRVETIEGAEFVKRYFRHVLPRGLRAIRYHGFCHPAAKAKRERIAFHTGRPLLVGALQVTPVKPPHVVACPCCGEPMKKLLRLLPAWSPNSAKASMLTPSSGS